MRISSVPRRDHLPPALTNTVVKEREMQVMIDIETMDNRPTSAIVSIGAVKFGPHTGQLGGTFYANVHLESSVAAGLTTSASTIMWWMQQSNEARQALTENATTLYDALSGLSEFVRPSGCNVWAHSPAFDLVILDNAYRALNQYAPWSHRKTRCARTIYDLAGIDLSAYSEGTIHNALDDAICQARAVMDAYKQLERR